MIDTAAVQGIIERVLDFASKLEGPYRWYVIGGVVLIVTAMVTRFVFKTYKWFILLALLGALVFGIVYTIAQWASLAG